MHEELRLQERTALLQAADGGLEPYNPDFNPIEPVFAKLKGLLRTAAARTVPDLGHTIQQAFARVTADECRNGIAAAGYNTDLAIAT
ncbi:hypothetical protein J2W79_001192 [Methylorubrum extorquens]|nr:hypothetical protein [Methylorubrum extorquens]